MRKGNPSAAKSNVGDDAPKTFPESVMRLVDMVLRGENEEKVREQAELTTKLYTASVEKSALTYRFLASGISSNRSNIRTSLPAAFSDNSNDECLVRLLTAIEACREQLSTLFFCRLLMGFLTCCKSSDKKFCLKVRLGGLVALFHNKLLQLVKEEHRLMSLLQLCCCSFRSVRNARIVGKSEKFVKGLITAIVNGDADALFVARLMEILYLIIKFRNRSVMLILESNEIFLVLMKVFEAHLKQRLVAPAHLEVCLFAVASLRNLSRLRRNRDRLGAIGAMERFHSAISLICNDKECSGSDSTSTSVPSTVTLQESLYALCMSCLPVRPFPISASTPPPITFPLPQPSRSPKQRPNWPAEKEGSTSGSCPLLCFSAVRQEEAAVSSDEDCGDDEEEALFPVAAPYGEGDEDGDLMMDTSCSSLSLPLSLSPTRLSVNRLTNDYSQYFIEFTQGTATAAVSGKLGAEKFAALIEKAVKKTRSVSSFVKIAYPAMIPPTSLHSLSQPLAKMDSRGDLLINELVQLREESTFTSRVVYDLDHLLSSKKELLTSWKTLNNDDLSRIGRMAAKDHLLFESRFEGGNLRRAIQVSKRRYQLILSPDINQLRPHYQWFYFQVSNNEAGIDYTFEIINCFKKTSMFNHGMQPVLFSVTEAYRGKPGWVRVGSAVCYCRNTFVLNDTEKLSDTSVTRSFFSLRFTIRFDHRADVCYMAYHFPYTYSTLQATLERYLTSTSGGLYVRSDKLCTSLAGNSVPLLTVTAKGTREQLSDRQIIVLSARVHPGESIMDYLTSDRKEAAELRSQFVFKIVPMLNVDGVVNGSHRCSLAGVDLNRTWDRPSAILHPVIYHTKALLQYMVDVLGKKPFVFVDLHGHSKHFNVFLFGNNPDESWRILDNSLPGASHFMSLPSLLQQKCGYFSLSNCRFNITKDKESSGRVTLWRHFGCTRAYTMESTYCGFDSGPFKGYQVNIGHLMEMGRQLCETFSSLKNYSPAREHLDAEEDSE